jgi:hypothetical protein
MEKCDMAPASILVRTFSQRSQIGIDQPKAEIRPQ